MNIPRRHISALLNAGRASSGSSGGVGSLNFGGNPSNVDHGQFWTLDTVYDDCYYSAWVKPTIPNTLGYYISDGSGGQHTILNGGTTGESDFLYSGNVWDGAAKCNTGSSDTVPLNEWLHYEFVSSGNVLYVLLNGICTFYGSMTDGGVWTSTYAGTRSFGAGGSNGHFYVGGSYHNNFPGRIAKIRGVEGSDCGITTENRTVPRDYNGYIVNASGTAILRSSIAADYSVSGTRSFIDMGEGFESRIHHGAFSRYSSATPYPVWVAGEVSPSTYIPTPPATPDGCLVFDSFSRVNNLELFDNLSSLGTTEAGSLGVKTWKTPYFDNSNRMAGVLYGRAILYPSQIAWAYVDTDTTDVDIRVTRPTDAWASTGILARYKDASNYYRIVASDTSIAFVFVESGVTSFPASFTVSAGWAVLRVVMSGTTMTVYVDGVSAGTKTVVNDAAALGHGITAAGNVARYDDFTIFAA